MTELGSVNFQGIVIWRKLRNKGIYVLSINRLFPGDIFVVDFSARQIWQSTLSVFATFQIQFEEIAHERLDYLAGQPLDFVHFALESFQDFTGV